MAARATIIAAPPVTIRLATHADVETLAALIRASASGLGAGYYDPQQIAAANTYIFGVDTQLVDDGSYFVAEINGETVGCGGWSRRATLFGGDQWEGREEQLLDPAREAARIRAFFVSPDHGRRGVARALLGRCEAEARRYGFARLALLATLPGLPFYQALGFRAGDTVTHDAGGTPVPFVHMTKRLDPTSSDCRGRSD